MTAWRCSQRQTRGGIPRTGRRCSLALSHTLILESGRLRQRADGHPGGDCSRRGLVLPSLFAFGYTNLVAQAIAPDWSLSPRLSLTPPNKVQSVAPYRDGRRESPASKPLKSE